MTATLNEGETIDRRETIARLATEGYALLAPGSLVAATGADVDDLEPLRASWSALPADTYLRDGGRYRFRRHSCFVQSFEPSDLSPVAHRAHWQPTTYNALHGGIERWFE